jgi:glycosyltransferase involved in cell wall biosynthesis
MRVLIFHGYLLGGTGSNVYNARLAQALTRLGHQVHLLCQERHPERIPFIDAAGDWEHGYLRLTSLRDREPRCTVYRPDIGELLPVYVQDRYEGFQARTFARCSDAELTRYIDANVEAVRQVAAQARPQVALANHLVMGPVILARALGDETPYAVKVHGSALEYTVKPEPARFLPYAREGIAAASGVLVGSRHTAESLWEALGERWVSEQRVRERTRLGPPGVDVQAFAPRDPQRAQTGLSALARRLQATSEPQAADGGQDAFARQEGRAAEALADLDPADGPIVVYVGKLIVSKGVDLLLAAWPLVLRRVAAARLVIVGFGAYEQALRSLLTALDEGDIDQARRIAEAGRALEGGPRAPLRYLCAFLAGMSAKERDRYLDAAAGMRRGVRLTGRLEHDELADLLPACEAIVVPSTFPEAFGMVAVEAAACGVLPLSAAHSGLAEVSDRLAAAVGEPVAGWLSFALDDEAVQALSGRLISWLTAPKELQEQARERIVTAVRDRWSWEGVADGVIAAAEGRLRELSNP